MSDLNLSDDEGFSGHEKILLEKHRSKIGKKSGIREVRNIIHEMILHLHLFPLHLKRFSVFKVHTKTVNLLYTGGSFWV